MLLARLEDIVEGIENIPEAVSRMLRGESRGKAMVRVVP
jgi:NADPH-dependent curcumin reductase CurA